MQIQNILKIFPLALFFIFVTIPMLNIPRDMWDGTIIEYASLTNDFSGLRSYFFESTWFIQYPLSLLIIEISNGFGISYKDGNAIAVFLCMALFLREIQKFAEFKINLSKIPTYFSLSLLAVFSTWGALFSSIMTLHFFCIAVGLLSVRAIHEQNIGWKFLGFLLLLISLSLQSQLIFLPVLSYVYDLSAKNTRGQVGFVNPSKETVFIFSSSVALYSMVRHLYPPHGQYEDYNSIVITSLEGLALANLSGALFSTFLFPVFLVVGFISILGVVFENKVPQQPHGNYTCSPKWLIWLFLLFCAGLAPYAAVGKYTALGDVLDWRSRQAFLIAAPTCLFAAVCLQCLHDQYNNKALRLSIFVAGAVIFVLQLILLATAVVHNSNRQVFVRQLENLLRVNERKIPPGLLEIVGSEVPGPKLRDYEANFLIFSATKKANWWTRVGDEELKEFEIPCHVIKNIDYQKKYIYNYSSKYSKNHTVVKIKVSGFTGVIDSIRNSLAINPPGKVEIIKIYSKSRGLRGGTSACE